MERKHQEGPYGGDGGKHFSLDYFTSIEKIGVAFTLNGTTSTINGITIDYTVNGVHNSVTFGGPGKEKPEFELQPGEYISSVEFYWGSSPGETWCGVRDITFVTSTNQKHHYGNYNMGTHSTLPADRDNGKIVGFLGRAGTNVFDDKFGSLDALGAYIEDGLTGGSTGTTGGSTGTGNI